ncbi:hypothetical protein MBLNU459_g2514t1 [Dothideomycetes sp. NU459]
MPSLYANYLDPKASASASSSTSTPATISSEPVKYSFKGRQEAVQEEKKAPDAALRFQPVKRPQLQQKPKPRPAPTSSSPDKLPGERKPPTTAPGAGVSIENWIHDDDDEDPYAAEYLRRKEEEKQQKRWNSRKRKKKNNELREVDFDAIYDPERPVRLADYKGSEEEVHAEHDWKQRLHAHQIRARRLERRYSSDRHTSIEQQSPRAYRLPDNSFTFPDVLAGAFVPPPNYNFAPPPTFDAPSAPVSSRPSAADDDDDDYEPPPPVPVVQSGPDLYSETSRLPEARFPNSEPRVPPPDLPQTDIQAQTPSLASIHTHVNPSQSTTQLSVSAAVVPNASARPTDSITRGPTLYDRPAPTSEQQSGFISRGPVRYERPVQSNADDDLEETDRHGGLGSSNAPMPEDDVEQDEPLEEEPRSNRPGQKGFAKRLMQKYGWKEGQGLGADGSGITTILRHQTQKRKKKPDAEGGGWAQPAAMGRIVGGKRQKTDQDPENQWSIVAKFEGIIDDMDLDDAIQNGNLLQILGDRMAQYGHVERLYIDRDKAQKEPVFVKFTSALSAYRAIQASHEQDFLANGRIVRSSFFDADKFEQSLYD